MMMLYLMPVLCRMLIGTFNLQRCYRAYAEPLFLATYDSSRTWLIPHACLVHFPYMVILSGLDPTDKGQRVANYHNRTVMSACEIIGVRSQLPSHFGSTIFSTQPSAPTGSGHASNAPEGG